MIILAPAEVFLKVVDYFSQFLDILRCSSSISPNIMLEGKAAGTARLSIARATGSQLSFAPATLGAV